MSPMQCALLSLEGLATGDAFGQCFFQTGEATARMLDERMLPSAPWYYTDDTEMSLSVVVSLYRYGRIEQNFLAQSFAEHYDFERAYGPSMHRKLERIRNGEPWREVSQGGFGGQGSFGNGAAMRAAPLGAYFAGDAQALVQAATQAAEITHAHPEGIAGAIAVALAAAVATEYRARDLRPSHHDFLGRIIELTPPSEVRSKLQRALAMEHVSSLDYPIAVLGNGIGMSAQDTVPFALWCCAQSLDSYEEALWLAVSALGDRDTICAIVGGVVASYTGDASIPGEWLARREMLPDWHVRMS